MARAVLQPGFVRLSIEAAARPRLRNPQLIHRRLDAQPTSDGRCDRLRDLGERESAADEEEKSSSGCNVPDPSLHVRLRCSKDVGSYVRILFCQEQKGTAGLIVEIVEPVVHHSRFLLFSVIRG
jgi:hypothetical protein